MPNDRLRIAFFGDVDSPHTQRWLSAMRERNCEIAIVTEQRVAIGDVKVLTPAVKVPIKGIGLGGLLRRRRIRQLLREFKPDIVHGHFIFDTGYDAAQSGFHPLVITVWGSDVYIVPTRGQRERRKARVTLARADLVTADSGDLAEAAVRLGAKPERTEVIGWGVDVGEFSPATDRISLRRKLSVPDGAVVFVSTRRLTPLYRVADIIRAFAEYASQDPHALLFVASDGVEAPALRHLAAALGVSNQVRFLGYVQSMAQILQVADVYVSVPESDATAVSLLEAMACGLPAIVSDLPSNREWVAEASGGWIAPVGDVEAIGHAMERALTARNLLDMGVRNRAIALERADTRREMDRMFELYSALAGGS